MPEPDLLALFVARLEDVGVRHLVTGSVAATLYGKPRATHDNDLVVALSARERAALATAFPEAEFYVAPPEYVIVRKLEFYREGGSPKHLRDIRAMLDVSAELIDVATIEDRVRRRGLIEAWSEAQDPRD